MPTSFAVATGTGRRTTIRIGAVFGFSDGEDRFLAVFVVADGAFGITPQNEIFGGIVFIIVIVVLIGDDR